MIFVHVSGVVKNTIRTVAFFIMAIILYFPVEPFIRIEFTMIRTAYLLWNHLRRCGFLNGMSKQVYSPLLEHSPYCGT